MAEYINMQQIEYDEVQTSLAALHEEILTGEETIRNMVTELITIEGGFYLESVSEKLQTLLNYMAFYFIAQLKGAYDITDQGISTFVETIVGLDVLDQ